VFTLLWRIEDEYEDREARENDVELLQARDDASKALEASKESLDFAVMFYGSRLFSRGIDAVAFRRDEGNKARGEYRLPGFIVPVRPVHGSRPGGGGVAVFGSGACGLAVRRARCPGRA